MTDEKPKKNPGLIYNPEIPGFPERSWRDGSLVSRARRQQLTLDLLRNRKKRKAEQAAELEEHRRRALEGELLPKAERGTYRQAYCELILELMEQTHSILGCAVALGVCRQTIYNWENTHPDFADALQLAREREQHRQEMIGREGMKDKNFNSAQWMFWMANRYRQDWAFRSQVGVEVADPHATDFEDKARAAQERAQERAEAALRKPKP